MSRDAQGNRLAEVKRAYRNPAGTLQTTSTVGIIRYDGMGRRIVKIVGDDCDTTDVMGDWETEYHLYYDGWSIIETRDRASNVLKQHLWGVQYIDELVQIALNDDPEDEGEDTCETTYWALQDANYNVLAILEDDGDIKERYEYTSRPTSPRGRRLTVSGRSTDQRGRTTRWRCRR